MATATAHPNIALVKYWGKRNRELNLPAVGSLSLTLAPFATRVTVEVGGPVDHLEVDGEVRTGAVAERVFRHLDRVEPGRGPCQVRTASNFPMGAGLASSASTFAALTLAAAAAFGRELPLREASILARQGSGSACRSVHGGWSEWLRGTRADGQDSYAIPLHPPDHWEVRMVVAIVDDGPKPMGSTEAMIQTELTSPFYGAWLAGHAADLDQAREAVRTRDLRSLGLAMERSAVQMHATMLTAQPSIRYWRPGSVACQEVVEGLRRQGLQAWWTLDAGPQVKVLCAAADAEPVRRALAGVAARVEVLQPGGPARLLNQEGEVA